MNEPPTTLDLKSLRARKARLGRKIGNVGFNSLTFIATACVIIAGACVVIGLYRFVYLLAAGAIFSGMLALWWKRDLAVLPATGNDLTGSLAVGVLAQLDPNQPLTPQSLWQAISHDWQALFFCHHFLLSSDYVFYQLSESAADLVPVWRLATQLAQQNNSPAIESGFVAAALWLSSPPLQQKLIYMKLQPGDVEAVANWLGRGLESLRTEKQSFGGIARDWTFGFTPLLNRFGKNISLAIVHHGAHFETLTTSPGVKAIETAFTNHAGAIALIGPEGIGKTSHIYALAQLLIQGQTGKTLAYHQIVGLDASQIIASAHGQGELEHLINNLANEAAHAGHIILFLDDAELFFSSGPGSFDATHLLLPIIQSRAVPLIMAMTPQDFQRLRISSASFASLLTPVVLQEPPEADTMRILEDTAINFEGRHKVLISYAAIREAYRLSGRYETEEAFPGKAIKLLEQAVSHAIQNVVTIESVQQAIEQTHGVKVGSAAPLEADKLLHLEDKIHERMINQTQAVNAVASALRRARAGVANPRRPIGSFLFLGPTGVGKTELAKAVAAVYFGAESNMVRLDMSEYQQPNDVQRLLATGASESSSLILSVRQQPFTVVLLDEIEKAHPNILNLMLQLLDEGQLTDSAGRPASFKDTIIIATSNAGADAIRERIIAGENLESFKEEFTDQLINSGQFRPELLNRFDEVVLFRPLNPDELAQVVQLMLVEVNRTLANQNITVTLTPAATAKIVAVGDDPRLGARPMRRALQHAVENNVAQKILAGQVNPGDRLTLDVNDLQFG